MTLAQPSFLTQMPYRRFVQSITNGGANHGGEWIRVASPSFSANGSPYTNLQAKVAEMAIHSLGEMVYCPESLYTWWNFQQKLET